jgi:acetyltransferase
MQISQLVVDRPEIVELDINPLFADDRGVLALDARIRVGQVRTSGKKRLAIRPYPRDLEEWIKLRDGRSVFVRPIRPEDQAAHERFVGALSPEDLRFRFLGVTRDVPRNLLSRLTQIDYDREMAFIAIFDHDDAPDETVAVVRTVADPDNTRADFAVMVRPDCRGLGLGDALMRKMIRYCQSRGIREIRGQVLADAAAMLKLCQRLGFSDAPLPGSVLRAVRLKLDAATAPTR